MRSLLVLLTPLLAAPAARAADILAELQKGPLIQVQSDKDGKFAAATVLALIEAPVEQVWKVVTDFGRYKDFMPKTLKSEPKVISPTVVEVAMEIDNPGPDTAYTARHELDPKAYTVSTRQVKGDLSGSSWGWILEPLGEKRTLARYFGSVKNFSSLAESLEDEQQTVTVGINVTAAVATVRAVKMRVEGK